MGTSLEWMRIVAQDSVLYLNTFTVSEYVKTLENGRMPFALTVDLSEGTQGLGWPQWRTHETRFRKADYQERLGQP